MWVWVRICRVDVGRRQAALRKLAGGQVVRAEFEDLPELIEPVLAGRLVPIDEVLRRKAGIDQHVAAVVGLDERAGDPDDAAVRMDPE